MVKFIFLVVAITVAVCYGQSPPVISETFSTNFHTETKSSGRPESTYYTGEAHYDYTSKKTAINIVTSAPNKPKSHDWSLELYNIHELYTIEWEGEDPEPKGECKKHTIKEMEPSWSWTRLTKYNETITYENHRIEVFTAMINGTEFTIGVTPQARDVPYFSSQRSKDFYIIYFYHDFTPYVRDQSVFTIPEKCRQLPVDSI